MNLLILGPQGSGKGTQAELLEKALGLQYFEAGKILRSIAASDNPKAVELQTTMKSGGLVSDEYMLLIAWDFINKHDKNKGFIFDGYPRSIAQYEHLEDMLRKFGKKIDKVIFIYISETETLRRLGGRRTCSKCGLIYNLVTGPKPVDDKCTCGGELFQREDDKPETIKKRLAIYAGQTQPIRERAKSEGILLEVDGERPIEVIHEEIMKCIR